MAFYEDKREHYGGALVLFGCNLSVAVPDAKTHRRANCKRTVLWWRRARVCLLYGGEFEGRVRWVLHSIRGLCVGFLLENSRFSVFEYAKRCFG